MPSFLPPAAASSEVLRTLDEQNEAQRNLEALTADVDIALEEIKGFQAAAEVQAQSLNDVQGERKLLEDQLHALQRFAEALAEAAVQKEAAIKAHISTVHLEEEALKSRQKDVKDGEAAVSAAHEARGKAEAKLTNAKAEHEKALKRAKAAGVVPELPSAVEAEKATKSAEKPRTGGRERKRSRSRSLDRRKSVRSRSRERDRRRSRSRERRGGRESPRRRRTPPPSWRERERERDRERNRVRDRRLSPRRPSPPRRRSRSRGRRSRTPERRRRSLQSPPRNKRGRSRSEDSRDAKKGRNLPSEKPEKSGKDVATDRRKDSSTKDREQRRKEADDRSTEKADKPAGKASDKTEHVKPSIVQQEAANGTTAETDSLDRPDQDSSEQKAEAVSDLPLPPPPKRAEKGSEPEVKFTDPLDEKSVEDGGGVVPSEAAVQIDIPKKAKKDKESKKHKKEKKEKKESKKAKQKEKDSAERSVSPAPHSP